MADLRDIKLKAFIRKEMKDSLLTIGRRLVAQYGSAALSARRLAAAANSSVGVIYNIFGTMDNFIAAQNIQTLNELAQQFEAVVLGKNPFNNLNHYADALTAYICANPNLWHLLYLRHLAADAPKSSVAEARAIKKIDILIGTQAAQLIGKMSVKEKRLAIKVLEMSLFSLSGYLLGNKLNAQSCLNRGSLCKLLMNIYMAGLDSLKRSGKC